MENLLIIPLSLWERVRVRERWTRRILRHKKMIYKCREALGIFWKNFVLTVIGTMGII
jgi:hypothetical protein